MDGYGDLRVRAEEALSQATTLLDAADRVGADLTRARATVDTLLVEVAADLAAARSAATAAASVRDMIGRDAKVGGGIMASARRVARRHRPGGRARRARQAGEWAGQARRAALSDVAAWSPPGDGFAGGGDDALAGSPARRRRAVLTVLSNLDISRAACTDSRK